MKPIHYVACKTGPCDQGRKICPSPLACRIPEGGRDPMPRAWLVALLVIVVAAGVAKFWP